MNEIFGETEEGEEHTNMFTSKLQVFAMTMHASELFSNINTMQSGNLIYLK